LVAYLAGKLIRNIKSMFHENRIETKGVRMHPQRVRIKSKSTKTRIETPHTTNKQRDCPHQEQVPRNKDETPLWEVAETPRCIKTSSTKTRIETKMASSAFLTGRHQEQFPKTRLNALSQAGLTRDDGKPIF
jgi:hypothetical protein